MKRKTKKTGKAKSSDVAEEFPSAVLGTGEESEGDTTPRTILSKEVKSESSCSVVLASIILLFTTSSIVATPSSSCSSTVSSLLFAFSSQMS